ncbi:MAG: hypothetical protein V1674_06650 [Candidatus Omnitrophota bacterium]
MEKMRFRKKLVFSLSVLITVIAILEIFLRVTCLVFPKEIYHIFPNHPEHDRKGFRNEFVPVTADIVAFGDSQTYGTGAPRDKAWPRQLADMAKLQVYSIAQGGYGPVHSLLLFEEAKTFKPKLIIEAFYAGNDLYDSYSIVYYEGKCSELKSNDKQLFDSIQSLEKDEPLKNKINQLFSMEDNKGKGKINYITRFKLFLSKNSKLYIFLSFYKETIERFLSLNLYDWGNVKLDAMKHIKFTEIFESKNFRTVFTPAYRLSALNLGDSRISEGFSISLKALKMLANRSEEANIQFVVLLIPTKELVFSGSVVNLENFSQKYRNLIENEKKFWLKTKTFLKNQNIYFIDALPALRKCIQENNQPYKITTDGHPSEEGHRFIVKEILDYLNRIKLVNISGS